MLGLMGSVRLRMDSGKEFDLGCGFTMEERKMFDTAVGMSVSDYRNPGGEVPEHQENQLFPRGSRITFQFRELTRDGYPKEARYWRRRVDD